MTHPRQPPPPPSRTAPPMQAVPVRQATVVEPLPSAWSMRNKLIAGGIIALLYLGGTLTGAGFAVFFRSDARPASREQVVAAIPVPSPGNVALPQPKTSVEVPLRLEPLPSSTAPVVVEPPPLPKKPVDAEQAFADLKQRGFVLELPPSSTGSLTKPSAAELCKLIVSDLADCKLALIGGETTFGPNRMVSLDLADPSQEPHPTRRTWVLHYASRNIVGVSTKKPVARLTLDQTSGALQFSWDTTTSTGGSADVPQMLPLCLLNITVGERSEVCQLTKQRQGLPIRIGTKAPAVASLLTDTPPVAVSPSGEALLLEFARDDTSATVPLSTEGKQIAVSAADPQLSVKLIPTYRDDVSAAVRLPMPNATPLAPPRKGLRFDLSTADLPCYFDLELADVQHGTARVLGIQASVLVQGYRYTTQPSLVRLDAPKPFSMAGHEHLTTLLAGKLALHEQEMRTLTKDRDAALQQVTNLESILQSSSLSASSRTRQDAARTQLPSAKAALAAAEKSLQNRAKFALLQKFVAETPPIVQQYGDAAANLRKFCDSLQFDYRIAIEHPQHSVVLVATAAAN